jgi:hypothetical protein
MKSLIKKCSIRALGYDRFLIGVYWMRRVQHSIFSQWSEFVAVAALIDPDTLILDIGANIGYVTAVLATVPGAHVHAFEPDAENFACLVRTVGQRPNVTVQKIAIGANDGEAVLRAVFEDGIKQHALSRVCTASEPLAADQRVSGISCWRRESVRAGCTWPQFHRRRPTATLDDLDTQWDTPSCSAILACIGWLQV